MQPPNSNPTNLPELCDLLGGGVPDLAPTPTISKSSALTKKNYKENISSLTINIQGGEFVPPPMFISLFLSKTFSTTCDETVCTFLFYTYEDCLNFKNCNLRLLKGILEGLFLE